MTVHPVGQNDRAARVFVSYTRTDTEFVDRLERDLMALGIQPWIDRRRLEGGQRWPREISAAIKACDIVLVVLSPRALTSPWVRKEYRLALWKRKRVIPLLYHPITQFPRDLKDHQWIDFEAGMTFEQRYPERFQELVAALKSSHHSGPARQRPQPPASDDATAPEATGATPSGPRSAAATNPIRRSATTRPSRPLNLADRWLLAFSVGLTLAAGATLAIIALATFGYRIDVSLLLLGLIEGVILALFTLIGGLGITAPIQRRGRISALRRITQGIILTAIIVALHFAVVAYASRFGIVMNSIVYSVLLIAICGMLALTGILAVANILA